MLRWPRPDEMILAACALNRQDQPASVRAEQLIVFQSETRKAKSGSAVEDLESSERPALVVLLAAIAMTAPIRTASAGISAR